MSIMQADLDSKGLMCGYNFSPSQFQVLSTLASSLCLCASSFHPCPSCFPAEFLTFNSWQCSGAMVANVGWMSSAASTEPLLFGISLAQSKHWGRGHPKHKSSPFTSTFLAVCYYFFHGKLL